MVDFPPPDGPTIAVCFCGGILKLTSCKTGISGRDGYVNETFWNSISSDSKDASWSPSSDVGSILDCRLMVAVSLSDADAAAAKMWMKGAT